MRTGAQKGKVATVLWVKVSIIQSFLPSKPTVFHSPNYTCWWNMLPPFNHRRDLITQLNISCLPPLSPFVPSLLFLYTLWKPKTKLPDRCEAKTGSTHDAMQHSSVGSILLTVWCVAACLVPTNASSRLTHPHSYDTPKWLQISSHFPPWEYQKHQCKIQFV